MSWRHWLATVGLPIKRIVNGVTTTPTHRLCSQLSGRKVDNYEAVKETLYQTRGGGFFVVDETTHRVWNERQREHETKVTETIVPISPEKAHEWTITGEVEIIKNPFEDPPEATIYIRVPASLKRSVDEAARDAHVPGNVWAMRCVENVSRGSEGYRSRMEDCINFSSTSNRRPVDARDLHTGTLRDRRFA